MKYLVRLVLIAVVAALAWWLWTIFFPSPAKVIRQRMTTLAATATFSAKDNAIVRASKAKKFSNLFTRDTAVVLSSPGLGGREINGKDELSETAMAAFHGIRGLKVEFLDVSVTMAPDQSSADVSCTARVRFEDSKDYGVNEMHFKLRKVEGQWLISRAETVRTLS